MKYSEYRFTLDLQKHQSQTTIAVFKGDTAVRLYISITDGGKPYIIESGSYATFYGMRFDGKPLIHDCTIGENSTEIIYEFQPATSYIVGIVNCQCRLYSSNKELITAPRFSINVEDKVVDDDDFETTDEEMDKLDKIFDTEAKRKEEENIRVSNEKMRQLHEYGGVDTDGSTYIGRVEAELAREEAEAERKRADKTRAEQLKELMDIIKGGSSGCSMSLAWSDTYKPYVPVWGFEIKQLYYYNPDTDWWLEQPEFEGAKVFNLYGDYDAWQPINVKVEGEFVPTCAATDENFSDYYYSDIYNAWVADLGFSDIICWDSWSGTREKAVLISRWLQPTEVSGDLSAVLDELHKYAQELISGVSE